MTETAEEQRTRILKNWAPGNEAGKEWMYDLAIDLGYQPESWDGMWKLTDTPDQFTYRNGYVIAREIVMDTDHRAIIDSDHARTRLTAHLLPDGWTVIDRRTLTSRSPRYMYVSPRMRERHRSLR